MTETALAAVRPKGTALSRIGAYAFGILFFGLIPVLLVIPFGPPPGHPSYLAAWALGAVVASFFMRRVVRRAVDSSYLTLAADRLTLGKDASTTILLDEVVDTIPILSQQKPFQSLVATVNPEQFTVVLLRLRDGSRLPLSARHNVQGFEPFLIRLFELVRSTIRIQGDLSADDLAVLSPRLANRLHKPGK